VLQSAGLFTVTLLLQPVANVAVMVTLLPTVIPVMVLPATTPALVEMVAPLVAEKATLYTPPPAHTPWPAVMLGGTQPLGLLTGQDEGLDTCAVVVAQPLVALAVIVTFVPVGIPLTVLPLTIPADAVTMPLELNVTL
jgi:hypothetical protein